MPCHLSLTLPLCLIPNPENHHFPPPLSPNFNKQPAFTVSFLKQMHFLNSQKNAATGSWSRPLARRSVTRCEMHKQQLKLHSKIHFFDFFSLCTLAPTARSPTTTTTSRTSWRGRSSSTYTTTQARYKESRKSIIGFSHCEMKEALLFSSIGMGRA